MSEIPTIGGEKKWEDMGVHTKLGILKAGITELMKMNLIIMKKIGINVEEEEDGREEDRQPNKHPEQGEQGHGGETKRDDGEGGHGDGHPEGDS